MDDLEDPTFSFSSPIRGCFDDEVNRRHEDVRHYLHSLTKGLLEMVPNPYVEYGDPQDIYFKYKVQFFPSFSPRLLGGTGTTKSDKSRLVGFDATDASIRLKLAEFKFARTSKGHFDVRGSLHILFNKIAFRGAGHQD